MYQPIIDFSYLVEINLANAPAVGQKIPFNDVPQLRTDPRRPIKTVGIAAFSKSTLTKSPNGNVVVTLYTGITLTLAIGSGEDIFLLPCIDLQSIANSGLIRIFAEKIINLPKSYITILDTAGLAQNESAVFNFIYRK